MNEASVITAGIAGLAAGVMLREFADVTVSLRVHRSTESLIIPKILESASELKEIGAAVTPGPGATGILRRFGIHLEKERGCVGECLHIWGGDGQLYAQHDWPAEEGHKDRVVGRSDCFCQVMPIKVIRFLSTAQTFIQLFTARRSVRTVPGSHVRSY
jgi:hypothetical protein